MGKGRRKKDRGNARKKKGSTSLFLHCLCPPDNEWLAYGFVGMFTSGLPALLVSTCLYSGRTIFRFGETNFWGKRREESDFKRCDGPFPTVDSINQSSVGFHCKPFYWLVDWRKVNFDLIGLVNSYRPICFYGSGAKVTEHRGSLFFHNT